MGGGDDTPLVIQVCAVEPDRPLTRPIAVEFRDARARTPLASAVSMGESGSRVVLDSAGSYVENKAAGERRHEYFDTTSTLIR